MRYEEKKKGIKRNHQESSIGNEVNDLIDSNKENNDDSLAEQSNSILNDKILKYNDLAKVINFTFF